MAKTEQGEDHPSKCGKDRCCRSCDAWSPKHHSTLRRYPSHNPSGRRRRFILTDRKDQATARMPVERSRKNAWAQRQCICAGISEAVVVEHLLEERRSESGPKPRQHLWTKSRDERSAPGQQAADDEISSSQPGKMMARQIWPFDHRIQRSRP